MRWGSARLKTGLQAAAQVLRAICFGALYLVSNAYAEPVFIQAGAREGQGVTWPAPPQNALLGTDSGLGGCIAIFPKHLVLRGLSRISITDVEGFRTQATIIGSHPTLDVAVALLDGRERAINDFCYQGQYPVPNLAAELHRGSDGRRVFVETVGSARGGLRSIKLKDAQWNSDAPDFFTFDTAGDAVKLAGLSGSIVWTACCNTPTTIVTIDGVPQKPVRSVPVRDFLGGGGTPTYEGVPTHQREIGNMSATPLGMQLGYDAQANRMQGISFPRMIKAVAEILAPLDFARVRHIPASVEVVSFDRGSGGLPLQVRSASVVYDLAPNDEVVALKAVYVGLRPGGRFGVSSTLAVSVSRPAPNDPGQWSDLECVAAQGKPPNPTPGLVYYPCIPRSQRVIGGATLHINGAIERIEEVQLVLE